MKDSGLRLSDHDESMSFADRVPEQASLSVLIRCNPSAKAIVGNSHDKVSRGYQGYLQPRFTDVSRHKILRCGANDELA